MNLTYVTSNTVKFQIGKRIIEEYNQNSIVKHQLTQSSIEIYEIQSMDIVEIASLSARQAFNQLHTAVAVTDVGFYFDALQGFPGPYVKYVNQWLTPEDIQRLLVGKENRNLVIKECLALITQDGKLHTYSTMFRGKAAERISENQGTTMERIYVPEGHDRILADWPKEAQLEYWMEASNWHQVCQDEDMKYQ